MGRKSLIAVALLIVTALQSSAQEGSGSFEFTENKGQWDSKVKFKGELNVGSIWLQQHGFRVVQHNAEDLRRFFDNRHGNHDGGHSPHDGKTGESRRKPGIPNPQPGKETLRSHAYNVTFLGSSEAVTIVPEKAVSANTNYFIGNDPSKWATDVSTYQAVVYKNIYPNVDVRYYSDRGYVKYDIIVHPGGELNQVAMRYEGADKLSIRNNELYIKTSVGTIKELYPYAYEFNAQSGRKDVECKFELADEKTVVFKVKNYSKTSTLVVDPTIRFVSFTGSRVDEYGFTATPGPDGSLFSGSIVFGAGFQTTTGAYITDFQGPGGRGTDVGIFKFTPSGQRAWATYLGGSDGNEYPHSLICDPQGNLIVMGRTYSSNFPIKETTNKPGTGADLFITKFNQSGTALIGSIKIGGASRDAVNLVDLQQREDDHGVKSTIRFYGDDSRSEVTLDAANNIYVAAQTQSDKFPIIGTVFQPTIGGKQDGVVLKINPDCNAVIWSSFLGGSEDDGAFVLKVNPGTNDIFVAGATRSNNLPGKQGAGIRGSTDGFVTQITNNGASVIRTVYYGTTAWDAIYGLDFDKFNYPYIMGITQGGGAWPVVNVGWSIPNSSQFVAKLKQDLSGFEYSTVWGTGSNRPNISPVAFLVDRCENVYISGWGGWLQSGTDPYEMSGPRGLPLKDARKETTDNRDFYFIVIEKNANNFLYGSYFGQTGGEGEHVDGGTSRYDRLGAIYQAICANCFGSQPGPITSPFPTTRNVWAMTNGALPGGCNLAAVKIEFNFAGVTAAPKSYFNGVPDTMGCIPFTVTLADTIRNAKKYEWDFDGDGTTDLITDAFSTTYTFNNIGTFRVRLIAVDSTSCNIRDTAYLNIRVRNDPARLAFTAAKVGGCESTTFFFDNLSVPAAGKPFKPNSFTWVFGDGTAPIITGDNDQTHTFPAPGTYPVQLILTDTNYCNAPDTARRNLRIAANVRAQFVTPAMGCAPYAAYFNNTSLGGHDFLWDFGDGTTSTAENPTHLYTNLGPYTIKLTAYDTTTCNKVHDTTFTIMVNPKPTAAFTVAPIPPEVNKPNIFTNLSTGATHYKWIFGDGFEREKNTRDTVMHQYNESGVFEAMLVAFNQFGCSDTAREFVDVLIDPLLDVPNAFTPGRFGRNSIIKPEGFGIGKMVFRIYNRSGVKVFESNDRLIGWDGTYKGQLQPIGVYAYTLDVVFTDGKKTRRTGDITLIR